MPSGSGGKRSSDLLTYNVGEVAEQVKLLVSSMHACSRKFFAAMQNQTGYSNCHVDLSYPVCSSQFNSNGKGQVAYK